MRRDTLVTLLFAGTALLVGGCASADSRYGPYDNSSSRYHDVQPSDGHYGIVDSIERTRGNSDNAVAGTIIGGVVGGVLGHQIGGGTGNSVATVAGAVGGAVVGHEVGQGKASDDAYRVRIRFDDGSYRTTTQASIGNLRVGDGVRIENGQAYRYGYR